MDRVDFEILAILQQDATTTVAEIAARIGLSQSPCWKRIQKLEAEGVLVRRVALLSPAKVGLGLSAYIALQLEDSSPEALEGFILAVAAMPEVIEFSRTADNADFILRVTTVNVEAYHAFYERLVAIAPLRTIAAHLVRQRIKWTTALPLDLAREGDDVFAPRLRGKQTRRLAPGLQAAQNPNGRADI